MKKKFKDEMVNNILAIGVSFFTKIGAAVNSVCGWLGLILNAILAYYIGIKALVIIVLAIILIDFCLGLYISLKHKKDQIRSNKLSKSALKVIIYVGSLMLFHSAEQAVGVDLITKLLFSLIVLTESWSITSILIFLKPNIPVLNLFNKFFIKEISSKLDKTEEEVEEILNNKKKK